MPELALDAELLEELVVDELPLELDEAELVDELLEELFEELLEALLDEALLDELLLVDDAELELLPDDSASLPPEPPQPTTKANISPRRTGL